MRTFCLPVLLLVFAVTLATSIVPTAVIAQAPTFTWARSAGGPNDDGISAMVADDAGNFYVTGKISASVNFGGITLNSAGAGDAFVAKYGTSGFVVWAKRLGAKAEDYGVTLALDGKGKLYVTGVQTDTIGTTARTFLAQFDTSGNLFWQIQSTARGTAQPQAIAVDPYTRDILISGTAYDSIRFGSLATGVPSPIAANQQDIFLARFDSTGRSKLLIRGNARSGGPAFTTSAMGLTCDQSGNTYLGGGYFDTINILGNRFPGSKTSTTPFIISLDTLGKLRYIRAPVSIGTRVTGMKLTPGNAILASGNTALLQRMNTDGVFDKSILNNGAPLNGNSIAVLPTGDVFLSGVLTTPLSVDSINLTANIYSTVWMLKLDSNLHAVWGVKASGTSGITFQNAYAGASKTGDRFLAGSFRDTATFGTYLVGSKGGQDGFYSHLFERSLTTTSFTGNDFCPGDSIAISYEVGGGFLAGNTFEVQLSDTSGNFAAPLRIANVGGQTSGQIRTRIPTQTRPGMHYRVRVVSTLPTFIGSPAPGFIRVFARPIANINPSTNTNICENDSVVIKVTGGTMYLWSTKDTSSSIVVRKTGSFTVSVGDPSGCPITLGPVNVTVHLLPPVPAITQLGPMLYSSSATDNQWYFNGKAIVGATGSSYEATQYGSYAVAVIDVNGCSSLSDAITVTPAAVALLPINSFDALLLAPTGGMYSVRLTLPQDEFVSMEVFDILGNSLGKPIGMDLHQGTTDYPLKSICPALRAGSYYLRIATAHQVKSLRFVTAR